MGGSNAPARQRGRPRRDAASGATGGERLLSVAIEAFAARGFEGASVRHIAAGAGVDPSLIAYQFGSKADLWRAAVDALSEKLVGALGRVRLVASDGSSHAEEAMVAAISHLVDLTCDNPLIAKFVMSELVQQDDRSDYVFQKLIRPTRDLLVPLISALRDGAGLDPDMAFFAFNGAIVTAVAGRPFLARMSAEAASERYFREQLKRTVIAQFLPVAGEGKA